MSSVKKTSPEAGEVFALFFAGVYCLYRAGSHAGAAVGTLIIVDRSVEIVYDYCFVRTLLFAYTAADTAVLAAELSDLTVVSRRT